ncbi:MAG TPA: LamG-like jellyroll fold domain-containing protein, partial [Cytophagaceae bacterium]
MKKLLLIAFSIVTYWNASFAQTGQALNFDGSNDYVSIGNLLSANSSYTKEAWIYVTTSGSSRNIISSLNNPFWISGDRLYAGNGGNYTNVGDPTFITLNSWIHVAVTYNAPTTTMKLYRNGLVVSTNSAAGAYVSENELIGSHNTGSIFGGAIDEVRIWNRALSLAEIQTSFSSCGISTTGTGLLANYHFDQGIAGATNTGITTLTDASGNANNGTLVNFALAGATSNWVAPGMTGSINLSSGSQTNVSCKPGATGAASVTPSGGTSPYTYSWSPSGGSAATATGLDPGIYTVTVADASGCSATRSFTITKLSAVTGKDVKTACNSYVWIDGNTYTTNNNTATHTLTNSAGCDSVVTLDLTLTKIANQTVTATQTKFCNSGSTTINLESSEAGVKYYLRNDLNDAVVAGPLTGTGSALSFSTGTISASTSYNVFAETNTASKGLVFDGNVTKKYVDLGNGITSLFSGKNKVTIEAWVKRTTTGSLQTIVSNYEGTMQFLLRIDSDRAAFWASNGNYTRALGTTILPVNSWIHLSGTWDGSTIKVYVNGILEGTTGLTGTFPNYTNITKIGGCLSNGTEHFPGSIGDVRIWKIVKTQAEISAGYATCLSGIETGLVALYNMSNGASSAILTDITGHGHNGTLKNMDVNNDWVPGPPVSCTSPCQFEMSNIVKLIVNRSSVGTDVQTACNSYKWIDGNTYTSSNNTATHNIVGGAANGCDSLVTLNLTIRNFTTGSDVQTACNSYKWIDGNTYTENNNTATHNIVGGAAKGCDSLVTLNLTIKSSAKGTDVQSACTSYKWIDGITYTASNNTATRNIVGGAANGCDSLVTLNLTINNPAKGTDVKTACTSYKWIDGI